MKSAAVLWLATTTSLSGPAGAAVPETLAVAAQGPQDELERGIWLETEEYERNLRDSRLIVRDPALNAYVRDVLCRTVGADKCGQARIYIVRTPHFNASMAPNGMMQVWTGLLLRMRTEGQLAAVLGHEFAHYERRHSLRAFKDMRAKTDAMAWLSFVPYVGNVAYFGMLGSIFGFSREMEREADLGSIEYMAASPFDPAEAATIWGALRAEQDATAAARKVKSRKDKSGGFFGTHPNTAERMTYLTAAAAMAPPRDRLYDARAAYRAAMAPYWPMLIDDQIKLNDFGASEFLLTTLAQDGGWTGDLLYARGELYRARGAADDFALAAGFYRQAIEAGYARPEAWRGLGLAQWRSGAQEEGRSALRAYLAAAPEARDAGLIRTMVEKP